MNKVLCFAAMFCISVVSCSPGFAAITVDFSNPSAPWWGINLGPSQTFTGSDGTSTVTANGYQGTYNQNAPFDFNALNPQDLKQFSNGLGVTNQIDGCLKWTPSAGPRMGLNKVEFS